MTFLKQICFWRAIYLIFWCGHGSNMQSFGFLRSHTVSMCPICISKYCPSVGIRYVADMNTTFKVPFFFLCFLVVLFVPQSRQSLPWFVSGKIEEFELLRNNCHSLNLELYSITYLGVYFENCLTLELKLPQSSLIVWNVSI